MNPFDAVQSFVEQRENGAPMETLLAIFEQSMEKLEIPHYAVIAHVDPRNPPAGAVMHHNYPRAMVEAFSSSKLYKTDPVLTYAEYNDAPFLWHDPRFLAQLGPLHRLILATAGALGIKHGFTMPIREPGQLASCSFVLDSITAIDERRCFAALLLGACLHQAARDAASSNVVRFPIKLSRYESECLELAARGLTTWQCGEILNVSESTVKNHIRHAMRRLGTPTRWQAIARALALGLIRFGDVLSHRANNLRVVSEAAEWLVRLDDDNVTDAVRRQHERWLEESPAHAAEMEALRQLYSSLHENRRFLSPDRWRLH